MDLEHKNKGHFASPDSSGIVHPNHSKLSNFFEQAHAPTTLIFISAILEIVLGVGVVFASITGFMEPLWFSNLMCLIGSLACTVGVFLLYHLLHRNHSAEQLIQDATRRIMNAQN
ncbi:hypothetical protein NC796_01535 [Aliifodinibius sp. S!AR15-10]|uniref:hypothetical protein n=1 Tax=Aliifodinibius sp. S!AR15-10 TaxID=2950437 RepID=UPI002866A666|nr:hypothetical protein [Aliifodinibius sp. S!AR15-10]MDR8389799.1 hypothetical protein [Aliifodinibius sp. S!AR15-10]